MIAGLERLGLKVTFYRDPGVSDALVTWSPWVGSYRKAVQGVFDKHGRPVIVMENGWLNSVSMRGAAPERCYQVALDGWNGTGRYRVGGPERIKAMGIEPDGFNWSDGNDTGDGRVIIVNQRGHSQDMRTAPPGWAMAHLRNMVTRPNLRQRVFKVRDRSDPEALARDLFGAVEMHVWTSNASAYAILNGVPVVYHGPNLMLADLASRPGEPLYRGSRQAAMERAAWAMWTESEITRGDAFAWLLETV